MLTFASFKALSKWGSNVYRWLSLPRVGAAARYARKHSHEQ